MGSKHREQAAALARENLEIFEQRGYAGPDGWVELGDDIDDAVFDTCLVTPASLRAAMRRVSDGAAAPTVVEVTPETTCAAARRLVVDEGVEALALLNFASGRNPGGGFLRGARAQEEDLARSSALYACLTSAEAEPYYAANHRSDALYTDAIVYSPRVPFFRDDDGWLLARPYFASILTAPAPNTGAYLAAGGELARAEEHLRRRAGLVLGLARARGHRALLLGAWGCGVFRNEPALVADAFGRWLDDPRFAGAFDRVVFAILDPKGSTRRAFAERFSG
ncbi:MAG: TIGR02452 family protein [Nannocystaceae bacterium]